MVQQTLMQLKKQRDKLLKVAIAKRKKEIEILKKKKEQQQLEAEIKRLKEETDRGVLARVKRGIRTATNLESQKKLKHGWKQFNKVLDKISPPPKQRRK